MRYVISNRGEYHSIDRVILLKHKGETDDLLSIKSDIVRDSRDVAFAFSHEAKCNLRCSYLYVFPFKYSPL